MPESRIPKQVLRWKPAGRKRGRPRRSWQEWRICGTTEKHGDTASEDVERCNTRFMETTQVWRKRLILQELILLILLQNLKQ
ncbi:hypothetical protein ILUMI_05324 [Ignelater luminosus]|uniref:Uncharacterized protein n=1 Tax=Ignelater luminosus TaxID=2038154 RepID=A0A8K0DHX4_IGNLU|nr:hypothetical protein ILUMI_05324 [Ignelater luminosus]